jgi:dihydrofolate reductase
MTIALLVAAGENEVIGQAGDLPWRLPEDLKQFAKRTRGHAVIAGRVTHEAIRRRLGHPLPGRLTVVLSGGPGDQEVDRSGHPGVRYVGSTRSAFEAAEEHRTRNGQDEIFVIGGAQIYRAALGAVETVYLTRVHSTVQGDTRMPPGWLDGFDLVSRREVADERANAPYSFLRYERKAHGESVPAE